MNIIMCVVHWRAVFVNLECDSGGGVYWMAVAIGGWPLLE